MKEFFERSESDVMEESHIKRMFYYAFLVLLCLIGCRFLHFQLLTLFSDLLSCGLIWVTVCTMNRIVSLVSLANSVFGIFYALLNVFLFFRELSNSKGSFDSIIIILITIGALAGYSLDAYASYFGFKNFGYEIHNNMDNENEAPNYGAVIDDIKIVKDKIIS